jgi:hypothetical protein
VTEPGLLAGICDEANHAVHSRIVVSAANVGAA